MHSEDISVDNRWRIQCQYEEGSREIFEITWTRICREGKCVCPSAGQAVRSPSKVPHIFSLQCIFIGGKN